jgi:mRNA-degrading endonuclease RelE of RelBE toxin-antitoxin system
MIYTIKTTPDFEREARRLKRKYRSLRDELSAFISELEEKPDIGIPIGHSCYKVRLAIKSKGRGKSTGARVITYVYVERAIVYLLSIYDKSEKSSISDAELRELLTGLK